MSGDEYLLDTNIVVEIFKGNVDVEKKLEEIKVPTISTVSAGELYFGAEKSRQKEKHLKQVNDFIDISNILEINVEVARIYAQIKNDLKSLGKPIPENDLWIAATSKYYNLVLVTKDKHFNSIKPLKLLLF